MSVETQFASSPLRYFRDIQIWENNKNIVLIHQSLFETKIIIYQNGEPTRILQYDFWGEEVADCVLKNNVPYSGTVWSYIFGLHGLKESTIMTYSDGVLTAEVPYKTKQIVELLEHLSHLQK